MLLAAPLLFRTQIAAWLIAWRLQGLGAGPIAFQVEEIGPTQARLRGIETEPVGHFRLAVLELRYRLPALLFGEIDELRAEGLRLRLDLTGADPHGARPAWPLGVPAAGKGPGAAALPRVVLADAEVVVRSARGPVTLAFAGAATQTGGNIELRRASWQGMDLGSGHLTAALAGDRLTFEGRFDGPAQGYGVDLEGQVSGLHGTPELTAKVQAEAAATALPRLFSDFPSSSAGQARASLTLAGRLPPLDRVGRLAEAALDGRFELILQDWAQPGQVEALALSLPIEAYWREGVLTGTLRLDGRLGTAGWPGAWLAAAGLPPDLLGPTLELTIRGARGETAPFRLTPREGGFNLTLETETRLRATNRLSAELGGELRGGFDRPSGDLALDFDDLSLRIESQGLPDLPLGALTVAGRLSGQVAAEQVADDGLLLRPNLIFEQRRLAARILRRQAAPLALLGDRGRVTLAAAWRDGTLEAGTVKLSNADLRLPELAIALGGLSGELPLDGGPVRFALGRVSDQAEPPRFNPLRAEGRIEQADGRLRLEAILAGPPGMAPVPLRGGHNLARGEGHLELAPFAVNFRTGGLQPRDLSPRLAALQDAQGTLRFESRLDWSAKGVSSRGSLAIDDLAFRAEGTQVAGLWLNLELDDLLPPSSPPNQRLSARVVDPAVPLRDIQARFQVLPGNPPALRVERAEFTSLGGRFLLADALFAPDQLHRRLTLQVLALDLHELFETVQIAGLSGEGSMAGVLPIEVDEAGILVPDARLAAEAPGVLRYRSGAAAEALESAGGSGELLLRALEDFRYEEFKVAATKSLEDELLLRIELLGRNPDVLEGHPFKFNINVTGNLRPLLQALSEGYAISDEALRRSWRLQP